MRELFDLSERRKYIKKMWDELFNVQMELVDDENIFQCSHIDFDFSAYYFEIKLLSTDGCQYRHNYFSCKTKEILKNSIEWILANTEIYEVTALVKSGAYVTFRCQKDVDLYFDEYYEYK